MNKVNTRRYTMSSNMKLVGKILKLTGIVTFSVVWLYAFIKVYNAVLTYLT